ncbi:MAG: hypothetical protein LBP61_06215 [Desulfovibrio sp.]|nr:hypothetical protein [Desulfovibrio sp.]
MQENLHSASQAVPALFPELIPGLLFLGAAGLFFLLAFRAHRRFRPCALPLFLALNCLTLGAALGIDVCPYASLPDSLRFFSPLGFTLAYLLLGGLVRHVTLWGAGLATPLLWFAAQRADAAFFHLSRFAAPLPQDPAWFLLCAALLLAALLLPLLRKFREEMEQPQMAAGFCYALAGLWRVSLGEPGILGLFALPLWIWAACLLLLALAVLWIARHLDDTPLALCGALGVPASLYSFGLFFIAPPG